MLATNKAVMGRFRVRIGLAWGGWLATALMAAAVVAMIWSLFQ